MFPNQSFDAERAHLEQRANSGARWFYWIAALSFVTSIIALSGSHWRFLISLGVTQLMDGIAIGLSEQLGSASKVVAVVFDLIATGVFALLGYLAGKRMLWSYVVGMIIFGLDGLIFLIARDWFGIIFHVLVIYWIFGGYRACRALIALNHEAALSQLNNSPDNLNANASSSQTTP